MPTGTTGDLRHLSDGQPTHAPPIELAQRSKGDMGDIHVQPHADGVGSDQIIHLARLKHGDLTIARMGRQRAHHDGSARSEEHTSELQSLMRISYAVFCLKKKKKNLTRKVTDTYTNNIKHTVIKSTRNTIK